MRTRRDGRRHASASSPSPSNVAAIALRENVHASAVAQTTAASGRRGRSPKQSSTPMPETSPSPFAYVTGHAIRAEPGSGDAAASPVARPTMPAAATATIAQRSGWSARRPSHSAT
jgi:hypothetical protein